MSTAEEIISDLKARGVVLSLRGDNIAIKAPENVLTDSDIAAMRKFKHQIFRWIQRQCSPHNDQRNYVDELVNGRIRTTCRVCGRFVGHRPLGVGADPNFDSKRESSISTKEGSYGIQF